MYLKSKCNLFNSFCTCTAPCEISGSHGSVYNVCLQDMYHCSLWTFCLHLQSSLRIEAASSSGMMLHLDIWEGSNLMPHSHHTHLFPLWNLMKSQNNSEDVHHRFYFCSTDRNVISPDAQLTSVSIVGQVYTASFNTFQATLQLVSLQRLQFNILTV